MKWRNIKTVLPDLRKVEGSSIYKSVPLVLRVWLSKDRYHIFQGSIIEWSDMKISLELHVHETGKSNAQPMVYSTDSFYECEWLDEFKKKRK